MLRTQKLGEADRIVTILTRRNGRVRAVAKGVRRTKSRFGARLEPFTHVDLLLYTGPLAGRDHPGRDGAAVRGAAGRGLPAVHQRHGHAGDRRAVHPGGEGARRSGSSCCWSAGCGRSARASTTRGWCSTPTCCARWRWPGTRPPWRSARYAATPDPAAAEERALPVWVARVRRRGRRADLPVLPACGAATPAVATIALMRALLRGDWAAPTRSQRPAPGRVQRPGGRVRAVAPGALDPFAASRGACVSSSWPGEPVRPPYPHPDGARPPAIPADLVPRHVALVMDGNGRWAKQRGLPRTEGHKMGESALFDVIMGAIELGIPYLSAYAFSTENWRRSPDEVRFLMGFNRDVIRRRRDQLNEMGVRVRWAGRRPRLWRSVISELEDAERMTERQLGPHPAVLRQLRRPGRNRRCGGGDSGGRGGREAAPGQDRREGLRPLPGRAGNSRRGSVRPVLRRAAAFRISCSGSRPTPNWCSWTRCSPISTGGICGRPARSTRSRDRRYGGAQPNLLPGLTG